MTEKMCVGEKYIIKDEDFHNFPLGEIVILTYALNSNRGDFYSKRLGLSQTVYFSQVCKFQKCKLSRRLRK